MGRSAPQEGPVKAASSALEKPHSGSVLDEFSGSKVQRFGDWVEGFLLRVEGFGVESLGFRV